MVRFRKNKNLLICILCSLVMAAAIFGTAIIKGNGAFTIFADFNAQQLPFATAVRNALAAKPFGQWVWNLDLGASLINGFSFFNFGSPFFWISVLFSKISFPYLAGYLYILKYVMASVTAYYYIRLFVKDSKYAVIGGLLYAFSGFQTTNLMFFHFHDVVAFFPLMLIGLELTMKDSKYSPLFIFAIFLNCVINYFFFIQEVIFLIIYFLLRFWNRSSIKEFAVRIFKSVLCGILGVGMGSIMFVPSVMYIMGNSRSETALYLQNLLYDTRHLLFILKGMILPGDTMNSHSAMYVGNWDSTSCYIPLFGFALVLAFVVKNKGWLRNILIISLVVSCSPLLQSGFIAFTVPYQRWWFMFVLMASLATSIVMEDVKKYDIAKYSLIYIGIILAYFVIIKFIRFDAAGTQIIYHPGRLLLFVAIGILGPAIIFLLVKTNKFNYNLVLSLVCLFAMITTGITLKLYRTGSDTASYMNDFNIGSKLKRNDQQYRYNTSNNLFTLTGNASGIGAFSSTVENSSKEFDALFDWYASNFSKTNFNDKDPEGLLLGGKYIISSQQDGRKILEKVSEGKKTYYIESQKACPIGFAVDHYIVKQNLLKLPKEKRAVAMMNAAVVDNGSVDKIDSAASKLDVKDIDYNKVDKNIDRTVENRVRNFKRDNTGFSCTTNYGKEKLVWFSVPYDKGWDAALDGRKIDVINSGGMMAIKVPKGEHKAVFKYHTPWLKAGAIISGISFMIFIVLSLTILIKRRRD